MGIFEKYGGAGSRHGGAGRITLLETESEILTAPSSWEYIFFISSLECISLKDVGDKDLVNMSATCMEEDIGSNLMRPLFNFSRTT